MSFGEETKARLLRMDYSVSAILAVRGEGRGMVKWKVK